MTRTRTAGLMLGALFAASARADLTIRWKTRMDTDAHGSEFVSGSQQSQR